jgi:hypothetical protein
MYRAAAAEAMQKQHRRKMYMLSTTLHSYVAQGVVVAENALLLHSRAQDFRHVGAQIKEATALTRCFQVLRGTSFCSFANRALLQAIVEHN